MRKTVFWPGLHDSESVSSSPVFRKRGQAFSPCNRRFSKGGAIKYTMRLFAVKVGSPELFEEEVRN
jgi:hypothetical protein